LLTPNLIYHEPTDYQDVNGKPNIQARVREKVRHILASHQPPPLSDTMIEQLDEIVKEAKRIRRST
jgi:trimethylamine:corrinoid methyltransferase-like protein